MLLDVGYAEEMAILAAAFADSTRVRILALLALEPICVGELAIVLQRSQSSVSHQLKLLRSAGLVESERRGKHIFYAATEDARARVLASLQSALGPAEMPSLRRTIQEEK